MARHGQITITITNPLGKIDYVNQVTSTQDGHFTFTYVPSSTWDGEYEMRIGGERVSMPYEGSFQIGDKTPGNGDNTPGGGDKNPGGGDQPSDGGDRTPGKGDNGSGDEKEPPGNSDSPSGNEGAKLPVTASNLYQLLVVGLILLVVGVLITRYTRKKINIE